VRAGYLLPHKVALVSELEAEDMPVACLGGPFLADLRWLWSIRRSLVEDPVDVVHAHSPLAAVGVRLVVRTLPPSRRPKVVTTEHSLWGGHERTTRWMDSLTWRVDDAHLAVSEAVRASLPAALARRTEVIPHGVDVDQVRVDGSARAETRAELGIASEALVVGTVANFRPVKAYPDLLAAAHQVVEELPGVRFVMVGQGPQEAEMRDLHRRLGLGDRVLLLGFRPDAVRYMGACDVFCLASLHEGLPVALMEALALGLPAVATDVGGIREVVEPGREGILVAPGRPDALAAGLLTLLRDPQQRGAMAAAAAEKGRSLSMVHAVRRTEAVYEELMSPRDAGAPGAHELA